jgi:dinuclear metal center YbgI/SA1388 family protein
MIMQPESMPCLADVMALIERFAPLSLAEEWDNCGLQIGTAQWPVKNVWVALDPLPEVVHTASEKGIDLLVTHHPLFFQPFKQIDLGSSVGRIIETAIKHQMAIYSAHTNLDSTYNGINDVLARMIGLKDTLALQPFLDAMEIDGKIREGHKIGLGRIGNLEQPCSALMLAEKLKAVFGLDTVRMTGKTTKSVERVAVCSGAGSSMMKQFLRSDADAFISGDLRYHDARNVEDAGRVMIDLGHFASEKIIIDILVEKLSMQCKAEGWKLDIKPCGLEQDPFEFV